MNLNDTVSGETLGYKLGTMYLTTVLVFFHLGEIVCKFLEDIALKTSPRSVSNKCKTLIASLSPNLQLNSITFRESAVFIKLPYKIPT